MSDPMKMWAVKTARGLNLPTFHFNSDTAQADAEWIASGRNETTSVVPVAIIEESRYEAMEEAIKVLSEFMEKHAESYIDNVDETPLPYCSDCGARSWVGDEHRDNCAVQKCRAAIAKLREIGEG